MKYSASLTRDKAMGITHTQVKCVLVAHPTVFFDTHIHTTACCGAKSKTISGHRMQLAIRAQ